MGMMLEDLCLLYVCIHCVYNSVTTHATVSVCTGVGGGHNAEQNEGESGSV